MKLSISLTACVLMLCISAAALEIPISIEETRVMGNPLITNFEIGDTIKVNGIEEPQEETVAPVGYFWMPYALESDLGPDNYPMLIFAGTFRPQRCSYFKVSEPQADCECVMSTTQTVFVYGVPRDIRSMDRHNGSKIKGTRNTNGTWNLELVNWPKN